MSLSLAAPRRQRRTRFTLPVLVSYLVLLAFSVFYLVPISVLLVTGLKLLPEVNIWHTCGRCRRR